MNNIVYVPGLSRSKRNPNGVVVVDADNAAEVERAERAFGKTPAMIDTSRGRHFVYKAPAGSLGKVGSLRKAGFEIDIKHGQKGAGIAVAPPSINDKTGFVYRWHDGSGIEALADLPEFKITSLASLLDRGSKTLCNDTKTAPRPGLGVEGTALTLGKAFPHLFRDGSRKLGLNDHLCAHASFIEDFNACMDVAQTWNDNLADDYGYERLPDDEVVEVCTAVMDDIAKGKLVRFHQQRATSRTDADEIRQMAAMFSNGDSALMLLMLFRAEHDARMARGETFVINIEGMVKKQVLGNWSARKYREARDTLLEFGLIECVRPAAYHRAAEYRLTDRVLTPSTAARARRGAV